MISLKDFIKNRDYELKDYVSEELSNKFKAYRCREYGFINEGSGVFDGNNKISKFISDEIKDNFDIKKDSLELEFTYEQLNDICNFKKFFNIIFVNVEIDKRSYKNFGGEGEYDSEDGDKMWDNSNKCFGIISIKIIIPFNMFEKYDSCSDLVEHELNHVFDDYHRHLNGKSMFYDKLKQKDYIKCNKFIDSDIAVIKRYLTKTECNSYISQLEGELEGKTFETFNKCIEWIDKNSKAWETYKEIRFYIDMSNNRKMYHLFRKNWNKFINHISFIIKDHINDNTQVMEKCSRDNWELKYYTNRLKYKKNKL